jgi:uncharacterized protein (TIGR03437 family)
MSGGQIIVQAPFEIAGHNPVQVMLTRYPGTSDQQVSNTFSVAETDNSLAVFTTSLSYGGQPGVQGCSATACTPNSLENPAPTSSIVSFYATSSGILSGTMPDGGIGLLAQNYSASLTIGGRVAQVLYAGVAPFQLWGMLQVNAIVPGGLASGAQPAVLTVGQLNTVGQNIPIIVQ